ncbi:hypothetical protein BaRGS_00024670, partial [Batillaria attramentaria]
CFMRLDFTAVPVIIGPQIEVHFTSASAGYIQTPGMDGQTPYPYNMDSWVDVNVPEHHVVMITFSHLDVHDNCGDDAVFLYTGGRNPENMAWELCSGEYRPLNFLLDTRRFSVHFTSDETESFSGFKLLFSFHNHTAVPQRLSEGTWNCSVPYFSNFQQHFRCDLDQDCAGAEDETDCPYTSEACGPGFISLGDGCYKLMMQEIVVSWTDASTKCQLAGGYLVSLNTREEWHNVTRLLGRLNVFVGLTAVDPLLPH